jgi:LDH2 family malate/lactate/ureidoglycolate dehydrogenase
MLGRLMGQHQMKGDYRTLSRGGVIIVMNPSKTTNLSEFKRANTKLIKEMKSSKKIKGVQEIIFPGERGEKIKKKNLKAGYLNVDKKLWEEIKSFIT